MDEHVTIGGYETGTPDGAAIPHSEARWFLLKLDRHNAPWAFSKGEPFRTISSLEMLGSLLGIMLLLGHRGAEGYQSSGSLSVGALTDNLGNRFILTRLLTTKWPLMAFLAEIAAQLEFLGV